MGPAISARPHKSNECIRNTFVKNRIWKLKKTHRPAGRVAELIQRTLEVSPILKKQNSIEFNTICPGPGSIIKSPKLIS